MLYRIRPFSTPWGHPDPLNLRGRKRPHWIKYKPLQLWDQLRRNRKPWAIYRRDHSRPKFFINFLICKFTSLMHWCLPFAPTFVKSTVILMVRTIAQKLVRSFCNRRQTPSVFASKSTKLKVIQLSQFSTNWRDFSFIGLEYHSATKILLNNTK